MDDKTLIKVRNRNNGTTGYTLLDGNKETRLWVSGETKEITFGELKKVSWLPGGPELLRDYLVIEDKEALEALQIGVNIKEQPEYFYTKEQIRNLLFNGTLDELRDFLDFSPEGGIEIAKEIAVREELPDTRKRKIISEATGFNIETAININHTLEEDNVEAKTETGAKVRRAPKPESPTSGSGNQQPVHRTNYKVISKGE